MKRYTVALVIVVFCCLIVYIVLNSAEVKNTVAPIVFAENKAEFSDDEVRGAIYSSEYNVPEGFYNLGLKKRPEYENSYDYLNHPLSDTNPLSGKHEYLCVNSSSEARQNWDDYIKGSRGKIELIESESHMYFDVTGVDVASNGYSDTYRYRNFKCAYLKFLQWEEESSSIFAIGFDATLSYRPIDSSSVKEFFEYLWLIPNYNMGGAKVLSSFVEDTEGEYVHNMYYTGMIGGDWGLCDKLFLVEQISRVDKATGVVDANAKVIREVEGTCH